jgi:ubiquitin-conjugating enzyme E2 Q
MFIDVVATEYRPGFIRLPGDDFVLSISLPVITLANLIPPRALMAWDRRLLASSQHLTLLISGFHGLYPVLDSNATYTPAARRLAVSLNFKVGLSERYKPGTEQVREVIRKHGLIVKDAEDELELLAAQQPTLEWGSDQEDNPDSTPVVEGEVVDRNRFDRFSLSSSLESLMDQSFLKLVQIRRRFGLGWAGAELLHTESEKVQMKEVDVLALRRKVSVLGLQCE